MASTEREFVDPYRDPATGILRNRFGATAQAELDALEAVCVVTRQVELVEHPIPGDPSFDQLRAIHRHLFQDVYAWAGEVRTVDMRKNVEGAQPFMPVSRIGTAAAYVFDELRRANYLRRLGREAFVCGLADFYDEINYLHPFREGNGRTQRVLLTSVAEKAGWTIDWIQINGDENNLASRVAASSRDLSKLREMFERAVAPLRYPGTRL